MAATGEVTAAAAAAAIGQLTAEVGSAASDSAADRVAWEVVG
jgi:hypothetical protein